MPPADGGLGMNFVGEKITINQRCVSVTRLLGEGGFSYVYLCKEISDASSGATPVSQQTQGADAASGAASRNSTEKSVMVLKVTSIHSRQQREIAEKEAKLLSRLSHPSIIKIFDAAYRTKTPNSGRSSAPTPAGVKERPQHMILMEFCEGGHALDVCNKLQAAGQRFDLSALIIAFGQICNAVSYLHAQRPPIVHRDLKPVNFLVKNGAYKLCDFGSAVFGHVDIRTAPARAEAEELIQKTTTQMFRAPEMVDLYMTKRLTQATDVWALGCCLYSLAFLQNCFEEGSNLAILSRNFKIPEDNPYGDGLVELLDRMLTVDYKGRADMTEVILCLSAVYSGRPLPPRKKPPKPKAADEEKAKEAASAEAKKGGGFFRTDGQGIRNKKVDVKKPVEAKKLNPNSAAARRRRAHESPLPNIASSVTECLGFEPTFAADFDNSAPLTKSGEDDFAFSTTANPFATSESADDLKMEKDDAAADHVFGSFEGSDGSVEGSTNRDFISFDACNVWGDNSQHDNRESHLEEIEQGHEVSLETHQQGSNDPAISPYRVRSNGKQPSGTRLDADGQSEANNNESPEGASPAHVPRDNGRRTNGESHLERLSVSLHDNDSQQEKSVKRRAARSAANRTRKAQEGDLAGLSMHSDDGDVAAARAAQRERTRASRHATNESTVERIVEEEPEPAKMRSASRTGRHLESVGGSAAKKPQRRALATEGSARRMSSEGEAVGTPTTSSGPRRLSNERMTVARASSSDKESEKSAEGAPAISTTPRTKPKRKSSLRNLFPQGKTKA